MPTYNHTPGDSPLNPCRECFDLQTNDERWAALADAGNDDSWRAKATDLRVSLGVATATLRYLHGVLVNVVDARNVVKGVADDLEGDQRRVQARVDAEVATATMRGAVPPQVTVPCGCDPLAIVHSCAAARPRRSSYDIEWHKEYPRAEASAPGPPAPDPRGGPFPPSPYGTRENVGISPRDLFEKAFRAGWRAYRGENTDCALALAAALNKEGLT